MAQKRFTKTRNKKGTRKTKKRTVKKVRSVLNRQPKTTAKPKRTRKKILQKKKRSFRKQGRTSKRALRLTKPEDNPLLTPVPEHDWESAQTFNPAAFIENETVHLVYRALGGEGISMLGYAASTDGIHIDERFPKPIFKLQKVERTVDQQEIYSGMKYISGGGCGGCEDPRITAMDDIVYMMFVAFDGSMPPRIALTSISLENFLQKQWKWRGVKLISPPGIVEKSGCLFPEKIDGKYVILHRIFPNIYLDFVDNLDFKNNTYLKGEYQIPVRKKYWDSRKIGAGAPPIKTKYGWLMIYYGVDNRDASQYKIGAMLLDLKKPYKVLHRTNEPILEPVEWYENEGHKAGVAYPCGAIVKNGTLFVYYGGADSVVCVAYARLSLFLKMLISEKIPKLKRATRRR